MYSINGHPKRLGNDTQQDEQVEASQYIVVDREALESKLYLDLKKKLAAIELPKDEYQKYLQPGRLPHQARLRVAVDCGYKAFCQQLIEEDNTLRRRWKHYNRTSSLTTYGRKDIYRLGFTQSLQAVTAIDNSPGNSLLKAMLGDVSLSEYLVKKYPEAVTYDERLITTGMKAIESNMSYIGVLCNKEGGRPSGRKMLNIIAHARIYNHISDDEGFEERNEFAHRVDYLGHKSPEGTELPLCRDWDKWTQGAIHDDWKESESGRRYSGTKLKSERINAFLDTLESRVQEMENLDEEIPWCLVYVGWTKCFFKRLEQHFMHAAGADIRNLIETLCYLLYPNDQYFMRYFPTVNVPHVDLVRMEHIVSICTGSYTCWGGLNGISGSVSTTVSQANQSSENSWSNARAKLKASKVCSVNLATCKKEFKMADDLEKLDELENQRVAAMDRCDVAQETRDAVIERFNATTYDYENKVYRNLVAKKDLWYKFPKEMGFHNELNDMLRNWAADLGRLT